MGGKYLLALDQGTTSSRCLVFGRDGSAVGSVQREIGQIYPRPGWVEHDPMDIWGTQIGAATEALATHGLEPADIAAIGIANQRETTVVWDRATGNPIHNAIVWQCRRTADMCDRLATEGKAAAILEKTGLPVDAYFSATKLAWILDAVPDARRRARAGDLLFGTIDSWLVWRLTRGRTHATDFTNASRTMLFNIHTLEWDDELLALFDIPRSMLPGVLPSSAFYGEADAGLLGAAVPVFGVAGDQQSALFGQLCTEPGEAKNTYGTGCFLLMHTGDRAVRSSHGLLTTLAASPDAGARYALEGSIFTGGAVVQWLRDELGVLPSSADSEALARSVADSGGVYVVPAFVGLGAPYWNPRARGGVFGLTRGSGRAHLARAALESMAYQTRDVIRSMEKDCGASLARLKVDGGASRNAFLMQFQSDILGCEVARPRETETTAMGAAYLAGLGVGMWDSIEALRGNLGTGTAFSPLMPAAERQRLLRGWRKAVDAALYWAEHE
jgi:glycerol kinase